MTSVQVFAGYVLVITLFVLYGNFLIYHSDDWYLGRWSLLGTSVVGPFQKGYTWYDIPRCCIHQGKIWTTGNVPRQFPLYNEYDELILEHVSVLNEFEFQMVFQGTHIEENKFAHIVPLTHAWGWHFFHPLIASIRLQRLTKLNQSYIHAYLQATAKTDLTLPAVKTAKDLNFLFGDQVSYLHSSSKTCFIECTLGYPRMLTGVSEEQQEITSEDVLMFQKQVFQHYLIPFHSPNRSCFSLPFQLGFAVRNKTRRLLNQDELILTATQFLDGVFQVQVIQWETMNMKEQISLASRLHVLVGVHGNNLLHGSIFMAPGSVLFELYPLGADVETGWNVAPLSNYGALARWAHIQHLTWKSSHLTSVFATWRNTDVVMDPTLFYQYLIDIYQHLMGGPAVPPYPPCQ